MENVGRKWPVFCSVTKYIFKVLSIRTFSIHLCHIVVMKQKLCYWVLNLKSCSHCKISLVLQVFWGIWEIWWIQGWSCEAEASKTVAGNSWHSTFTAKWDTAQSSWPWDWGEAGQVGAAQKCLGDVSICWHSTTAVNSIQVKNKKLWGKLRIAASFNFIVFTCAGRLAKSQK